MHEPFEVHHSSLHHLYNRQDMNMCKFTYHATQLRKTIIIPPLDHERLVQLPIHLFKHSNLGTLIID